jgi:ring-1,2-phenylacetyl-CoA epoxidase subunit PaaE
MSTHFVPLKVKDIRKETNDCVSVSFEIEGAQRAEFAYHPGQYITMRTIINNEEVRRSYSICSAPHEQELRVAIKQVPQGAFSTYANSTLKVGDVLDLMPPMGHFVIPEGIENGNFYGFASGSGITPVMSIMKHVLANKPNSTFTLVYGNKNLSSIIFKEQIDALKNIYMERLNVVHILSREHLDVDLHYGRIGKEKCSDLFSKLLDVSKIDAAFICGPEEMTMQVKDFLIEAGVPAKHVKFELFGTNIVKKEIAADASQGPTRKVSIKVDSRTITFDVAEDGEYILDAALKNGADLPFACKGGVCCTCRAKVVEGQVRMDVNYALEQEEIDAGFVLTCQAHPISEHVVIDFDVR